MIGIKSIGSYIPESGINNLLQAARFGESEAFIAQKIGATQLPVMPAEHDTSDLAVAAVRKLQNKEPNFCLDQVDVLVVVTQNGDEEALPHTSAIVHRKLELSAHVAAFDISLGCSGFVYGLYALKGFMEASGLKNGLLITADPYSKIVDRADRVTSLLFGDAASATWLAEEPEWNLGLVSYGTDGSGAEHLCVKNGCLIMNGRQVFNFAATKVAPHINQLLEKGDISATEIDAFIIHQGSAAIVDAIARRFKGDSDKFIKDLAATGNTVSSSIPILLEKYAFNDTWKNLVVSGFGVGLSWATAVLQRNGK